MTKKLEEEFNLSIIEEVEKLPTKDEVDDEIVETKHALFKREKINLAFKEIKGPEDLEVEMDDIGKKALESYETLMQLGMNVSDMAAGKVFAEASNMFQNSLRCRDAQDKGSITTNRFYVEKKARIDKFSDKGGETESIPSNSF